MIEMTVSEAMRARKSVRKFLSKSVEQRTIQDILDDAARCPSASNTQPWRVYVCTGTVREALSEQLRQSHDAGGNDHVEDYPYYPQEWQEPYIGRRRAVGKEMYGLLGIPKGDKEAMHHQYGLNYAFFGAPVGLFFTIERVHGQAPWIDLGSFIYAVTLAAAGRGLGTCAQQAFARYHKIVRAQLAIPDTEILVCGMSLGFADESHPVNRLATRREAAADFATFSGF